MTYILITPAKNEEQFLPLVAESVVAQSVKPTLWLIVDDGSTDNTSIIVEKLKERYPWIIGVRLPPHPRDLYFHYSYVCKCGFDHVIDYAERFGIRYDYIGLVDADTVLEYQYFEKLISKFESDSSLGIASGSIHEIINGSIKKVHEGSFPRGTGRLWTLDCFRDTGGYVVEAAAHSISNVKAIQQGYHIKRYKDITAVQQRPTRSAEGLWKTYLEDGELAHYLNKHPLLVTLNTIYFTFRWPYYVGLPYLGGYLCSIMTRKDQIKDEAIKCYYWNTRKKEYIHMLKCKLSMKPS